MVGPVDREREGREGEQPFHHVGQRRGSQIKIVHVVLSEDSNAKLRIDMNVSFLSSGVRGEG
jgi:hypothetical protein